MQNYKHDNHFIGEFAMMWLSEVRGKKQIDLYNKFLPSLVDIINGIYEFDCELIDQVMIGYTPKDVDIIKKDYREVFDFLQQSIDISDVIQPLNLGEGGQTDLYNALGVAVSFVMFMYTIEPPFYYHLN